MSEAKPARWDVLDVLRGAAVAGMILATSPGDWNRSYAPLRHAEWNGWTLTDMVFPAFLFSVGVALGPVVPASRLPTRRTACGCGGGSAGARSR